MSNTHTPLHHGIGRLLVLLFAALAAGPVAAQTPSQLAAEELIERSRQAATDVTRLEAATKANLEALRVIEQDIAQTLVRLREEMPARPISLSEFEPEAVEEVTLEIEKAERFVAAWKQRRDLIARARDMFAASDELGAGMRAEHESLFDTVATSRAVFIEAQRRLIRGDLTEAQLGLPEGIKLDVLMRRSADLLSRRRSSLEAIDQLLALLAQHAVDFTALPADDPRLEREGRRAALGLTTIAEATAVQGELLAQLEALPPETLPTEIDRIIEEWQARLSALEQAAGVVGERESVVETLVAERAALRPPKLDEVNAGEGLAEVVEARRDVEFSKRLIAYYEADAALGERVGAARVELLAVTEEASGRHGAFSRQTARFGKALAIVAEHQTQGALQEWSPPNGLSRLEVWGVWSETQVAEADRIERAEAVRAAIREAASAAVARDRLALERENLQQAEDHLVTELSYAEFMSTMQERSDEELRVLLSPNGDVAAQLKTIEDELVVVTGSVEELTARSDAIAIQVRGLENQYTRAANNSRKASQERIRDGLERLSEGEVLVDLSGELTPTEADHPPRKTKEPLEDSESKLELDLANAESRRIAAQQQFARILLRFYIELQEAHTTWSALVDERRAADERHADLLRGRIRELKLRYAAALELRSRVRRGDLALEQAPDNLEQLLDQGPLTSAAEELRAVVQRDTSFDKRSVYELERLGTLAGLTSSLQLKTEAADDRARLIGLPVSHLTLATTSIDKLDDVQRNNLQYSARGAESDATSVWDASMERFTGGDVLTRYEEPLTAYHLALANKQRVIGHLEAAESAYAEIVAVWVRDKEQVAPLRDALNATLGLRVEDYHAARYVAAIARHPGSRKRLEEAYRQAHGRPLPYRLAYEENLEAAADLLWGAETRLVAERVFTKDIDDFLSKFGADQEIGWYEEQTARIASLLENERALEEDLYGDIQKTRNEYRKVLRNNTIRGLGITLLIPIVAFVLVRILRRTTRRFEAEVVGELGEDEADRRRRLRTLARTGTATVSVLIWILAVIYIFAKLGLDITPIIASASVVGLAVAFGAQALIKDYFYGFFILIENQFTVGDIVKLGPVTGTVEQISLRITTLRDLKGTVHYIPNGSIGQVSNLTQGWSRVVMEVSVSHDEDPDRVSEVLGEVLRNLAQDETWRMRLLGDPVVAGVENLSERSVDIRVMIKTRPGRQWEVAREARRRIKKRFVELGIAIPFPYAVLQDMAGTERSGHSPEQAS
jgi:small conductance mechanosensitive channel